MAPTFDRTGRFTKDEERLTTDQRRQMFAALQRFVADLAAGRPFHPSLRVKGVRGAPGVFEMTWAPDGRATFEYGTEVREGEVHIVWRRIGTHDIFRRP